MQLITRFLLLASLLFSMSGVGARELKFITIDVVPWAWTDSGSGLQLGVFPDIIDEIERRSGHSIEMIFTPFARVDRELETGRQDCTILVRGEPRSQFVEEGEVASSLPIGVIARKGVKLASYADLKPLTISVLRGAAMPPKFENDQSLNKEVANDYLTGLRKIAHKRLDAIGGAVPTIRTLAAQNGFAEHLGDHIILADWPLVLQCSVRSKNLDVLPELNGIIQDMQEDGTLEKIKLKYY